MQAMHAPITLAITTKHDAIMQHTMHAPFGITRIHFFKMIILIINLKGLLF